MSDKMEIDFKSWNTAAGAFDGVAGRAPASIDAVVSGTTDPGACGAAGGMATVGLSDKRCVGSGGFHQ